MQNAAQSSIANAIASRLTGNRPTTHAAPTISSNSNNITWATIKLDYQMRGEIAVDADGQKFIEADLNPLIQSGEHAFVLRGRNGAVRHLIKP